MRVLAVLCVVACVACVASADIWSNCGQPSDHLHIDTVKISPDPPVKGQNVTVWASGTLDETVTSGTINIKVKYGFVTLLNKSENLCQVQQGVCPLAKGAYQRSISVEIPSSTPSGHYTAHVTVVDMNNQEIACIDADFHL